MHIFTVFALGKFKIRVCQGVRKPYFEPFLPIFEIFCLFLKFSTLESCYIWLVTSLEYPSTYVYCCCPEKIQNRGQLGGYQGVRKPYFEPF